MHRWRVPALAILALTTVLILTSHGPAARARQAASKSEAPAAGRSHADSGTARTPPGIGPRPAGPVASPGSGTEAPAVEAARPRPADGDRLRSDRLFSFLSDPAFDIYEKVALWMILGVAIAGLLYALWLATQVIGADEGTPRMREVGAAIRQGANAYLRRQFRAILPLVFLLTAVIWATAGGTRAVAIGRAVAFFAGATFSWTVGFVGMSLAVRGNLRLAAAARTSYGSALLTGYRTGTITGMLTDGLGLLGGTVIFMTFGEHAYEVLLGFGFGGTLLALFMRVGGGIYTKAADVGADLVGKVEAGIPEDDPRNAATIADNVGDNVGDCAGMAADIFESYEVTMVAAMILGYASFGHKGVIFPLLVRAIGVLGSIWSTSTVKAGPGGESSGALGSVHRGFALGSIFSVVGFVLLGLGYLHFDRSYYAEYPQALGGGLPSDAFATARAAFDDRNIALSQGGESARLAYRAELRAFVAGYDGELFAGLPVWATLGTNRLDMRPAWTCLVGIILAMVLNRITSYYTHTSHEPVKSLARSCTTGHATNIIQGLAVGFEAAVAGTAAIAAAILVSVLIYKDASPIFVAYGVAMCGIGMLTLTGNTISMDVFGPVADNANGIGEMGYDREEMGEENHRRARQILADLDAVGNTTKAETKGIAIGSAVIAAVSLFASFIAVLTVRSEDRIGELTIGQFRAQAGTLSFAYPEVFVGALIGGAIPMLFSSMLVRAVGRAAFLIVKECRVQFRDKAIWAGTRKPDYSRVVNICTAAAQAELIGPALLAILMPILVAIFLGTHALGGYLAGMIIVGQLMAVFMADAGGAWDNAKKLIEDGHYGGKGSEAHRAAITGDTVGDPLKDTAGPALNPLIKVMNMVALLAIVPILNAQDRGNFAALYVLGAAAVAGVAWAVWRSKTETRELREVEAELAEGVEEPATAAQDR